MRAGRETGTELGILAAQYIDRGQLAPDELVVGIVDQRLQEPDCENGYLLDGFPRTVPQADALDELLQKRNTKLDLVQDLNVTEDELIEVMLHLSGYIGVPSTRGAMLVAKKVFAELKEKNED